MHVDAQPLSQLVGFNMRSAGANGILTNTNVGAADTVAGLRALFAQNTGLLHTEQLAMEPRYLEAANFGVYQGTFTDGTIAGLTTVAGLVNLTEAANFPNDLNILD